MVSLESSTAQWPQSREKRGVFVGSLLAVTANAYNTCGTVLRKSLVYKSTRFLSSTTEASRRQLSASKTTWRHQRICDSAESILEGAAH